MWPHLKFLIGPMHSVAMETKMVANIPKITYLSNILLFEDSGSITSSDGWVKSCDFIWSFWLVHSVTMETKMVAKNNMCSVWKPPKGLRCFTFFVLSVKGFWLMQSWVWCSISYLQKLLCNGFSTGWFGLTFFWYQTLWLVGQWWWQLSWFSTKNTFIFWEGNHGINMVYTSL